MHKGKAKKGTYQKKGDDEENMVGGHKMPMHNRGMDKMMNAGKKKKSKKKRGY